MVTVLNSLIIILRYYQTILIKNTITIPKYYLIESESPFLILVMWMEHLVKLETQHLGKKHVLHNKTHMTIISFWVGAALVLIQLLQFLIWCLLKGGETERCEKQVNWGQHLFEICKIKQPKNFVFSESYMPKFDIMVKEQST